METRHRSFDALRGIAILMVVLAHVAGPLGSPFSDKVFAVGLHGVDIFFALSGFLIGGILLEKRKSENLFKTFYARRAFRILPAYVLLLISYVVVKAIDDRYRFGLIRELYMPAGTGWSYLFLLQNNAMAYVHTLMPAWLMVTWSLAIEEQFYLLAPCVARVASPKMIAFMCMAAIVGCPLIRYIFTIKGSWLPPVILLLTRADALCVGVLLAVMIKAPWWGQIERRTLGLVALGFGLVTLWSTLQTGSYLAVTPNTATRVIVYLPTLWALGSALLVAYLAALPPTSGVGLLVAAGKTSYFVYLFHFPAIILGTAFAAKFGVSIVLACGGSLVLMAGLAEVVWATIERPSQEFGRARFKY